MSEFVRRVTQLAEPLASRLGQLDVELTERCNNDCIHCCINLPADDAMAQQREMTTGQVREILKQASDLGCLQVRLTGGEPLLRSDFEDLYLVARRLGMKVLLFTNARLITPRLADLFVRIPPLVPIEVTVYGMHQGSYEAVTRTLGSFAQFWQGMNLLLDRGVPVLVKSALLPQNQHEMNAFEAWANTIQPMTERPGYSLLFDLRNRRDDAGKNRLIKSVRPSPREGLAALTRDDTTFRKKTAEFASKCMGPPGDQLFRCGASEGRSACVDSYGRAQPCMGIRAPELTVPLLAQGAEGAFRMQDALARFVRLRELRATNPDYLAKCAPCILRGLCEQCPAKSWAEHGTLDTPVEDLCELAHAEAYHLGWLSNSERGWQRRDGSKTVTSVPTET
jgi:radical SAM protein with 4Fe4S-binding SPASM domain